MYWRRSLKPILAGCETSLTQGRYTWRDNQVLKSLACLLQNKRVEVDSLPVNDGDSRMSFVCERGRTVVTRRVQTRGKWGKAWDWRLETVTAMKSGVVLYSGRECIVYSIELMIPFEDAIEEAFERKKLKHAALVAEA